MSRHDRELDDVLSELGRAVIVMVVALLVCVLGVLLCKL